MKYRFSPLPNTAHSKNFTVHSQDNKNKMVFNISKELLEIWGNPLKLHVEQFMIAHVKKHGWAKEPVAIDPAKTPRSLTKSIIALQKK